MSRYAHVVLAYEDAYPDPIVGKEGDVFLLGGRYDANYPEFFWATAADDRCGWVPKAFLRQNGDFGRLLRDYTARELTVDRGEMVEIIEEVGGWFWAATNDRHQGWIPSRSVTQPTGRTRLASM